MKLKYIPGIRPTPMLAYYTDADKSLFEELAHDMEVEHVAKYHHHHDDKHYWNMNAYIIVHDNKVESVVFGEFIYVIYLLRVINKELIIEMPDDYLKLIENDLNQLQGEIELIK